MDPNCYANGYFEKWKSWKDVLQSARDTEKYESPVDEYWGTSCSHKSTLFYPHFIPIVAAEIVK